MAASGSKRPATRKRTVKPAPAKARRPAATPKKATPARGGNVGQTIWLAGLGALARAHAEGARYFETLVKAGLDFDTRVRKTAQARVVDIGAMIGTAGDALGERTGDFWKRIDGVFEERLGQALSALPVVRRSELQALDARVEELARSLEKMQRSTAKTGGPGSRAAAGEQRPVAHAVKRVRDELADVAKELENAQIASRAPARKASSASKR